MRRLAGFVQPETTVLLVGAVALTAIALPLAGRAAGNATEATAARAEVRAAIPLIEAYRAEHGSYEGLSTYPLKLTASAPSRSLLLRSADSDSYCLMSQKGDHAVHLDGPTGAIEDGPCPPV